MLAEVSFARKDVITIHDPPFLVGARLVPHDASTSPVFVLNSLLKESHTRNTVARLARKPVAPFTHAQRRMRIGRLEGKGGLV